MLEALTNLPDDLPGHAPGARALTRRQIDILGELAEVGLDIVIAIRNEIQAAGPGSRTDLKALVHAYDRAARAVRLSLTLQDKLLRQPEAALPETAEAEERMVSLELIVREAERRERPESLHNENLSADRLDRDSFGDIFARPVSETISLICHDLGLGPEDLGQAREGRTFANRRLENDVVAEYAVHATVAPAKKAHRAQAPPS